MARNASDLPLSKPLFRGMYAGMKRLWFTLLVFLAKKLEVRLLNGSKLLRKWWVALGYKRDAWFRKANPDVCPDLEPDRLRG